MLPRDLKPESFTDYTPEARKLVTNYLAALRRLPLPFVASLLREVIDYQVKFPAEQTALQKELANLSALSVEQTNEWFQGFAGIDLSPRLEGFDWVKAPSQFVEQLSSHLWTTHQVDAFRRAAMDYADRLSAAVPPDPPAIPRLGIAVIGQGVATYNGPLFRKLRPHGAHFTRLRPENGLRLLLEAVAARAQAHPVRYGHWYVDGGQEADHNPALTCVSYQGLEPARTALLRKMRAHLERPGMGPEMLRTLLAQVSPSELGFDNAGDARLDHFQVKLLTEASGTQIFSTSFVQWTAREALRRAQPVTLVARFAPRQRQKSMNELLSDLHDHGDLDPLGSLLDADMGAYYNFLNQQRLTGAKASSFLVWFEDHGEAVAIGPAMPRATESTTAADLGELLSWML